MPKIFFMCCPGFDIVALHDTNRERLSAKCERNHLHKKHITLTANSCANPAETANDLCDMTGCAAGLSPNFDSKAINLTFQKGQCSSAVHQLQLISNS